MESGMATADDARRAQAHQEEQNDRDGENAALHGLVLERGHRRTNVGRLVERDGKLNVGRDATQVGHRGADRVDHADGVAAGLLEHADVNAALAVDADDLVLIGGAVFDLGDVGDANRWRCSSRTSARGPAERRPRSSGRAWGNCVLAKTL